MRWISDKNAKPAIFHDLVCGGKVVATVRRVGAKRINGKWNYKYQVIRKWADIMGGAYGHVWPSLSEAKRSAEAVTLGRGKI